MDGLGGVDDLETWYTLAATSSVVDGHVGVDVHRGEHGLGGIEDLETCYLPLAGGEFEKDEPSIRYEFVLQMGQMVLHSDHKKNPHWICCAGGTIWSSAKITNSDIRWLEELAELPKGMLFTLAAEPPSLTEHPWEPRARWTAMAPLLHQKKGQLSVEEVRTLRQSCPTSRIEGLLDWTELYREAKLYRRSRTAKLAALRRLLPFQPPFQSPLPQSPLKSPKRSPKRVGFNPKNEFIGELDLGKPLSPKAAAESSPKGVMDLAAMWGSEIPPQLLVPLMPMPI